MGLLLFISLAWHYHKRAAIPFEAEERNEADLNIKIVAPGERFNLFVKPSPSRKDAETSSSYVVLTPVKASIMHVFDPTIFELLKNKKSNMVFDSSHWVTGAKGDG